MTTTKLQAFLYILARDYLPTGKVERILKDVSGLEEKVFTCPLVVALAEQWAGELVPKDGAAGELCNAVLMGLGPDTLIRCAHALRDELNR